MIKFSLSYIFIYISKTNFKNIDFMFCLFKIQAFKQVSKIAISKLLSIKTLLKNHKINFRIKNGKSIV